MNTASLHALAAGSGERRLHPEIPDPSSLFVPATTAEAAEMLRRASAERVALRVWGGGTHQGFGFPVASDAVLATSGLDQVIDWQPDDLTVVVGAGVRVADLEAMLAERGQTAVLPEITGSATVGGVVAAGVSGWRRLGYGPTRDRILQVQVVTGDGRIVTAGGTVVKNVTGYDLPRLAAGSFGALGLIATVCLKLWPSPVATGTIPVADAAVARTQIHRPLAVIETGAGAWVYVSGTPEAVAGCAADLGSEATPGLNWPEPLTTGWVLSLRVPAALLAGAVGEVRRAASVVAFQAAHGVGEIKLGVDDLDVAGATSLRGWAETRGGHLVVERRPHATALQDLDPWGSVPASIAIQRRIKSAFDPAGIINPGLLPGRL